MYHTDTLGALGQCDFYTYDAAGNRVCSGDPGFEAAIAEARRRRDEEEAEARRQGDAARAAAEAAARAQAEAASRAAAEAAAKKALEEEAADQPPVALVECLPPSSPVLGPTERWFLRDPSQCLWELIREGMPVPSTGDPAVSVLRPGMTAVSVPQSPSFTPTPIYVPLPTVTAPAAGVVARATPAPSAATITTGEGWFDWAARNWYWLAGGGAAAYLLWPRRK